MKKVLKSSLSLFLAIALIFGSAAVGLTEIDFGKLFAVKANAEYIEFDGYLSYVLNSDGKSYTVEGCDSNATGALVIPATFNGKPVTAIDDYAIHNCHGITSVTIGKNVKNIGEAAFSICSNLKTVTMGDGVTSIEFGAFANCKKLTSIKLSANLESIGESVFGNCTSLASITIPNSVISIGDFAFSTCSNLKNVTLGNNLENIGYGAFRDCESIVSITIPSSVIWVGDYAFEGCESLNDVHISDIGAWCQIAFEGWHSSPLQYADNLYLNEKIVTDVDIPDGVTCIGAYAFLGCEEIVSLTIPDSVTTIGEYAFYECINLDTTVWGEGIVSIGEFAFSYCEKISSVIIPDTTEIIGDGAFDCCESLETVVIGDGVTRIEEYTFFECSNLSSITIGKNVTSIAENAFYQAPADDVYISDIDAWCCIDFEGEYSNPLIYGGKLHLIDGVITEVVFPEHITKIPESILQNCTELTSVVIPEGVTTIDDFAFFGCTSLETISIPDGVTSIGQSAFENCTSLTSISIPDSVTAIESWAFDNTGYYNNSSNWSDGVLYIDNHLIGSNNDLTGYYEIKEGTKSISGHAFYWRRNLTSVYIPSGITHIGDCAFEGCSSLSSVVLPDTIKNIGFSSFEACDSLEYIQLSGDLESIGTRAFARSGLKSIRIPGNVEYIGFRAFDSCESLVSIYISDAKVTIDRLAFCDSGYYNDPSNWENGVLYVGNHLVDAKEDISGNCVIREGTKTIAVETFYGRQNLTGITVPASLIYIGEGAFFDCDNLDSLYITDVAAWCGIVFEDRYATPFNEAYYSRDVNLYLNGKKVVDLVIPAGVKKISDYAFYQMNSIESLTLPDNLQVIGNYAFESCYNIKRVSLSHGMRVIGEDAFSGCMSIEDVYCKIGSFSLDDKKIGDGNGCLFDAEWHFNSTTPTPVVTSENSLYGVLVKWNAVEEAVKYEVYRRQSGSSKWVLVGTTTDTSLTDTDVTSGVYYAYSVRAYNYFGSYSDYDSSCTSTRKYMAVPKLTGISNATNGLYIKWDAVAGVTNGYRVYRRGAGSSYWTYLGTTKNTYYTDAQVKNNSGEYFRYTVIADGGYHSKFDTTGLYLRRLSNPTLKSATSAKAGITVKWTPVKGCLGYYVYRKTADSNWVRIGVVNGINSSSYLDKTAKKGVTYTYTVRAVCGNVTSYFNSGISCKDKY